MTSKIAKNRYVQNFQKDSKLILTGIIIFIFWSVLFLLLFYKPVYKSSALVWVKSMTPDTFVVDFDKESQIAPLTSTGNPILTQMEILKSRTLSSYLFEYIKNNFPQMLKDVKSSDDLKGMMKVDYKAGSDILEISLNDNNPVRAKSLLDEYLRKYQALNTNLNKEIKSNKRKYIDEKLADVSNKLFNIRNYIKQYKKNTLSINIDEETNRLVDHKADILSQIETVSASINNTNGLIKALESQLSMNSKEALNAVALGIGNDNLNKLRNSFYETTQEYVSDRVKMAETNPKLVALKNKIGIINNQIKDQVRLTLGNYTGKNNINIFDPSREKLVTDLVTAQTQLFGYKAQKNSLLKSLHNINHLQSQVPERKFTLDNLGQEEKDLALAYDQLKQRQIEARIKEAEETNNIVVVDNPSIPRSQSFPHKLHIIILAIFSGGIFGLFMSALKTYFEDVCEGLDCIKRLTKSQILGIVPWTKSKILTDRNKAVFDISYKNIATNLTIKCYKKGIKSLAFTSTSPQKCRSTMLYNLACELKKSGKPVILVDADFMAPTIHKDANITEKIQTNLSELIISIEDKIRENQEIGAKEILNAIVEDENGLKYLVNNFSIEEPYEYFATTAFNVILVTLKDNFAWILIDTPPAAIAPEFLIISKQTDGAVLFTNISVKYSALKEISGLVTDNDIPIIGTIVREKGANIEKDYAEYMKSLQGNAGLKIEAGI